MIVSKEEAYSLKEQQPTHFNYIDKTGVRFGMLSSLHYAGRDTRGKHQFACECDCGQFCLVTSVNLNSTTVGCGCLQLKGFHTEAVHKAARINIQETEDWIHTNTPYLVICENEASTRSKWNFYCKEHGTFKAILNLVKQDRVGCPVCRPGGGYSDNQAGILYVNKVFKDGNPIALKFGITNISVERRIYQSEFKAANTVNIENIFSYRNNNGKLIRDFETEIKNKFKTKVLTKETLPDGYTETVSLEDEENLIQWLKSTVNN